MQRCHLRPVDCGPNPMSQILKKLAGVGHCFTEERAVEPPRHPVYSLPCRDHYQDAEQCAGDSTGTRAAPFPSSLGTAPARPIVKRTQRDPLQILPVPETTPR